jgi:hypothetical protein
MDSVVLDGSADRTRFAGSDRAPLNQTAVLRFYSRPPAVLPENATALGCERLSVAGCQDALFAPFVMLSAAKHLAAHRD